MSLLKVIREGKNIRKLFGARELKIIEKQLLGIKLKPSEITRLSRDIRKKFLAINELANYAEEFQLKKASEIRTLIEEAKTYILESKYSPKIKKIILFGSAATNELTFRSDIDIAVEFVNITQKEATEFRIKMSGSLSNKIDIQVYNTLPEKIKKEIEQKGRILYGREN